jgi:WD repeat and SOF domain-containing protein 1
MSVLRPQFNVSVISRNEDDFKRSRIGDMDKVYRNADPSLHPFSRAREYTRALNAAKLDKMFSKPFLFALDGHRDGIYTQTTVNNSLVKFASASGDGEIKLWDLSLQKQLWSAAAHRGIVKGLASTIYGDKIISVGMDSTAKVWSVEPSYNNNNNNNNNNNHRNFNSEVVSPLNTFLGENAFSGVDCHYRDENLFVTAGARVDLYDLNRSEPLHSFEWGSDSINTVKLNKIEPNLLVSSASDRSVVLYDIRSRTPIRKIILNMQTNAICWNPMAAFYFSTASEDSNCYSFDTRRLDHAVTIHEDHVSAVMSVDYSPTGAEIVTGGYDRTIRIFPTEHGHSRDIYHTKRMQRVFSVKYTLDSKYIVSASDDCNVRLWKASASEKLSSLNAREQQNINYRNKLKQRFGHNSEIRSILRHKHVPQAILSAKKLRHEVKQSRMNKDERVRKHTAPEKIQHISAKTKTIRKEIA